MRVSIMGPIGSGKSTQAEIIALKLGYCWLSTGQLSRQKAMEGSCEGKLFKQALSKGELVDDDLLANVLKQKLQQDECKRGVVMDGYPRRMSQLQAFDPQLDRVVDLDISDSKVIERLVKRGRADDTPELIKKRLQVYHNETEAVLDYYRNLGKLTVIDGNGSIGTVTDAILAHLKQND